MSRFNSRDKGVDAAQEATLPLISDVRQALALSHYDLVRAISTSIKEERRGIVRDVFDSLVSHNPRRAAMVVAEAHALLAQDPWRDSKECETLRGILSQCRGIESLRDALVSLPTVDAHRARIHLCHVDAVESMARVLAPMMILRSGDERSIADVVRVLDDRGSGYEYQQDPDRVARATHKEMNERYLSLVMPEEAPPEHRQMIDDLVGQWREALRPESYGYENGSGLLVLDGQVPRLSGLAHRSNGGDVGYANRLRDKAMRARVFVPYSESPDRVSPHGHQCVDSASVARAFFSERGIPSDVFLVTVGEMFHNVTVVYFSVEDKYLPVLVDASPFGGFYPLSGEMGAAYWRPQSVVHVYGIRERSIPFVDGFLGPRSESGMIPWFCEDSVLGRVVGFAGVCDRQVYPGRRWERGTDEYYGGGEKVRLPSVLLTLFSEASRDSSVGNPKAMFVLDGETVRVEESSTGCSPEVLAELHRLAITHLRSVSDTIERLSIPIGRIAAER